MALSRYHARCKARPIVWYLVVGQKRVGQLDALKTVVRYHTDYVPKLACAAHEEHATRGEQHWRKTIELWHVQITRRLRRSTFAFSSNDFMLVILDKRGECRSGICGTNGLGHRPDGGVIELFLGEARPVSTEDLCAEALHVVLAESRYDVILINQTCDAKLRSFVRKLRGGARRCGEPEASHETRVTDRTV